MIIGILPAGVLHFPNFARAAGNEITNLQFGISHESYQTWYDLTTLTNPPELTIIMALGVSQSYVSGGTIELPLNFTPT